MLNRNKQIRNKCSLFWEGDEPLKSCLHGDINGEFDGCHSPPEWQQWPGYSQGTETSANTLLGDFVIVQTTKSHLHILRQLYHHQEIESHGPPSSMQLMLMEVISMWLMTVFYSWKFQTKAYYIFLIWRPNFYLQKKCIPYSQEFCPHTGGIGKGRKPKTWKCLMCPL
jgi:hypothetical protein